MTTTTTRLITDEWRAAYPPAPLPEPDLTEPEYQELRDLIAELPDLEGKVPGAITALLRILGARRDSSARAMLNFLRTIPEWAAS